MGNPPSEQILVKPSRLRFVVLAFICTLALLTYLDRVCISRVQRSIEQELNIDRVQMGWVFSAFFLGYALLEIPGGWMGDLWGARRVLGRIVLWWSAFTAITGCVWRFAAPSQFQIWLFGIPLISSWGLLILIRFLFGAGEAGAFPNINRVTRSWFPAREWGSAQGAVWMCARLGGAVAPAITGLLAESLGWRQAFWALGALGVVWSVVFLAWFRDRPDEVAVPSGTAFEETKPVTAIYEKPGASGQVCAIDASVRLPVADKTPLITSSGSVGHHAWPPLGLLLTSVSALATCSAAFCVCFPFSFYITSQQDFYEDVYGLSAKDCELWTGLPLFFGAGGALVGGWLSDQLIRLTGSRRWGRSLVGIAGFAGAGLCVLATYFATQAWEAALLLCLALFYNDLAIPTIWAALADIGGRYVGTLSGLANMVGNIGGAISPVLIPNLLRHLALLPPQVRWQNVFTVLACVWFVAAASWLFIDAGTPLAKDA